MKMTLKDDKGVHGKKLYPQAYSLQGFTTNFCQGCVYLAPSLGAEEDIRVRTCSDCIPSIDRFYRNKQPLLVTHDEEGKNIAIPLIE